MARARGGVAVGGAAKGGGEPPLPDVRRGAIELAWAVARLGADATPPVAVPAGIRPLLRFAILPSTAIDTVRRVLDDDEAFRSRVAEVAASDPLVVGRAGWLWLSRPDGWEDEVSGIEAAASAAAATAQDEAVERSAARRLRGAEEARARAERKRDDALAREALLDVELAALRAAHETLIAQRDRLDHRVTSLVHERDVARRAASGGADALDRMRSDLAVREEELRRLTESKAEVSQSAATTIECPEQAATGAVPPIARSVPAALDTVAISAAIRAAGVAAATLGDMLERAAELLGDVDADRPPVDSRADDSGADRGGSVNVGDRPPVCEEAPAGRQEERSPRPVRTASWRAPSVLPPFVFDDSEAAAAHLVRLPGVLVLVDGYNASMACWPANTIDEQRRRLLDALAELSDRTGAEVLVVFDSDLEHRPAPPRGRHRRPLRVQFAPPGIEADDVLIGLVAVSDADRPLVVASSDRRVQDGARRGGANVISSAQLLAALGREPQRYQLPAP